MPTAMPERGMTTDFTEPNLEHSSRTSATMSSNSSSSCSSSGVTMFDSTSTRVAAGAYTHMHQSSRAELRECGATRRGQYVRGLAGATGVDRAMGVPVESKEPAAGRIPGKPGRPARPGMPAKPPGMPARAAPTVKPSMPGKPPTAQHSRRQTVSKKREQRRKQRIPHRSHQAPQPPLQAMKNHAAHNGET